MNTLILKIFSILLFGETLLWARSLVFLLAASNKSFLLPIFDLVVKQEGRGQGTTFKRNIAISSVQFSSVAQSCPTLCDPMNRKTPGLPVHHQLPEFTQTHVHRVGDAIQPSHSLSSLSPPAPNPSQHQSLFQ